MNQELSNHNSSNDIKKYRERYVAFIDMLGFSEHIYKSIRDKELFKTIKNILTSKAMIADRAASSDIQSYQFSDSIIISAKNDQQGLKEIIHSVHIICDNLLYYNILTRGGITKGNLYDNSKTVFGPGFLRAYHIEKDVAEYPRILIDHRIYREVKEISYLKSHFRRDFDYLYHLDILRLGPFWYGNMSDVIVGYNKAPIIAINKEEWLISIKNLIEEELLKQKNNISIIKKYEWMARYFNSFLRKSKDFNITSIKLRCNF